MANFNDAPTDPAGLNGDGEAILSYTLPATKLVAWPQLVLFEPFVGVGNQVVQATLTSSGSPVAGQTIAFSHESTALGSAPTNSKGVARCMISSPDEQLLIRTNHYTTTFAARGENLQRSEVVR